VVKEDMDSESVSASPCVHADRQLQSVAYKCWVFGDGLRGTEAPEAQPIVWLQKGLELLAIAEAKGVTPGLQNLQVGAIVFMANQQVGLLRSAGALEVVGPTDSSPG
jgi:hypothetical protein